MLCCTFVLGATMSFDACSSELGQWKPEVLKVLAIVKSVTKVLFLKIQRGPKQILILLRVIVAAFVSHFGFADLLSE